MKLQTNVSPLAEIQLTPSTLERDLERLYYQVDPLFAAARHRRDYFIAGERFATCSDLQAYLDSTDRALASTASPGAPGAPGARILIAVGGENGCPKICWATRHFEERRIDAILAPTRYRMYFYEPLNYWQVYDRQTATGLQIQSLADSFPTWDSGSPLRNFLQWRLAAHGGALVHAGTLGIGNKGVLLAGAGGSGKSGTVLGGILSGLTTVGDDYVYVTPDDMCAYPLFETLKQDASGLDRVGLRGHPAVPAETNWQGKYQLFLRDLTHDARVPSLTLNALLLPTISDGDRTLAEPISAKEAFLALAPSGVTQIPGDRPLLYTTAAAISRALPCFRLHLGRDPAEVSAALYSLIENL